MTSAVLKDDQALAVRVRGRGRAPAIAGGIACSAWAAMLFASNHPLAAWVALVPSLVLVQRLSPQGAATLGAATLVAMAALFVSWIPPVLVEEFSAPWSRALVIWLLAAGSLAPAGAILTLCARRLATTTVGFCLGVGALWFLAELFSARVVPGIGWVVLGASQVDSPVASLAAVSGVHGVSALVATTNAVLARIAFGPGRAKATAIGVGLVALALVPSFARPNAMGGDPVRLRVALIQPGLAMPRPGEEVFFENRQLAKLDELTATVREADWVIWPEGSALESLDGRPDLVARIQRAADEAEAPILLGAPRSSNGVRWSSVFLFAPAAEPRALYDKRIPVPLVEHLPRWARSTGLLGREPVPLGAAVELGDGIAGDASDARSSRLDFAICFEATYSEPGERPDSVALVNVTNDGWYDRTVAPAQHLQLVRWRAIERGAHLLRATATGTTAIVSPDGSIVDSIPLGESGALTVDIPARSVVTPFERLGYAPNAALAGIGVLFLLCLRPRPT